MTVVHALSILAVALGQAESRDPRPFPPEVVTTAVPEEREGKSIPLSEPRLIPVKPEEQKAQESPRGERKGCAAPRQDSEAAPRDAPR
jgi:hypothetical protein